MANRFRGIDRQQLTHTRTCKCLSCTERRRLRALHATLAEYDPTDEPADLLPRLTADSCDRTLREHAALALRAQHGDLDTCELEDLA